MVNKLYSLSLLPDKNTNETLQQIIDVLSVKYGGPKFESHITLLNKIKKTEKEVIKKTKNLASHLEPFTVTTGDEILNLALLIFNVYF